MRSLRPGLYLVLSVLLPVTPSPMSAQEAAHEVQAGETLWELAGRYLSDPFRWSEI